MEVKSDGMCSKLNYYSLSYNFGCINNSFSFVGVDYKILKLIAFSKTLSVVNFS